MYTPPGVKMAAQRIRRVTGQAKETNRQAELEQKRKRLSGRRVNNDTADAK